MTNRHFTVCKSIKSPTGIGLLVLTLSLGACSSDSTPPVCVGDAALDTESSSIQAFVAERAIDYSSGQIERISGSGCATYPATGSDTDVATDGQSIYQLGKFQVDTITRFSTSNTTTADYQYSIAPDTGDSANPYDIVFVSETKAYVIQYGSAKVLIINPSAQNEESFKVGELDLSAYDSEDNVPNANGAVLVGDRLFILMERLAGFTVNREGYVAVFDTVTDTEVDTLMGTADGLNGIPVGVRNPRSLQYSSADQTIYLIGRGDLNAMAAEGVDRYTGGVVSIDPESFDVNLILDDGTEPESADEDNGFVNNLLVHSMGQAYVVKSKSFDSSSLYSLNLLTNQLADNPLTGLADKDITSLVVDPIGRLWVGLSGIEPSSEGPGFKLLQAADGSDLDQFIKTSLVPINTVFVENPLP